MSPKIIEQSITTDEVRAAAKELFGDFVKAVVDIQREIMTLGGEMHADGEQLLLGHGSQQADLWGINIYPEKPRQAWIEFDSMVNIRPAQGNRSRSVEDEKTRARIVEVVNRLIQ